MDGLIIDDEGYFEDAESDDGSYSSSELDDDADSEPELQDLDMDFGPIPDDEGIADMVGYENEDILLGGEEEEDDLFMWEDWEAILAVWMDEAG